jgi:hypothetical protein
VGALVPAGDAPQPWKDDKCAEMSESLHQLADDYCHQDEVCPVARLRGAEECVEK